MVMCYPGPKRFYGSFDFREESACRPETQKGGNYFYPQAFMLCSSCFLHEDERKKHEDTADGATVLKLFAFVLMQKA